MTLNKRYWFIAIVTPLILMACGLKIKYSRDGASIPSESKTFSVNFFENRSPYVDPTLSNKFTESLKQKFRSQTNLEEITGGDGDLHFEGEIVSDHLRPVSITQEIQAAATRITITIKVKYTSRHEGKYDFETSFSASRDISSTQDRSQVNDATVNAIIEEIVDKVYEKAVINW